MNISQFADDAKLRRAIDDGKETNIAL